MNTPSSKSKPCPCGCETLLSSRGKYRPIVCPAFWRGLPAELRSNFTSPAVDLATRRVACRRILEMAHANASQRLKAKQLTFNL